MKKKILAILIGALMLVSLMPVGSLAAKDVTVTPNANGGEYFAKFERTSSNSNFTVLYKNMSTEQGVTYKASFDVFLPKRNNVTFHFGFWKGLGYESSFNSGATAFAKLDNTAVNTWVTKEIEFTAGATADTVFRFGFSKASGTGVIYVDNLKLYRVSEPDTNLLENGDFETEFTTASITAPLSDGSGNGSVSVVIPDAAYSFYKGGNSNIINGSVSRVSSDTVSVPDNTTLHSEDFQTITTEAANTSSGGYVTRSTRGSVEVVADPVSANADNKVMKVNYGNVSNQVASVLPMKANDVTTPLSFQYGDGDTMKISFRAYIPEQSYGDNNSKTDGFDFGITYNDNGAKYATAAVTFGANNTDKWLDFEAYISAVQNTTFVLRFYMNFVGVFYVDDIKVEQIDNNGYVSKMNVIASGEHGRTTSEGGSWATCYWGTYAETVASTGTVQPVVAFAPGNTTAKGLAVCAVYKKVGDALQLVDIKFEDVARVARTAYSGFTSASDIPAKAEEVGIASTNLAVDLSTLPGGEYEVQTFLWNYVGFAPISNVTTFTVVSGS